MTVEISPFMGGMIMCYLSFNLYYLVKAYRVTKLKNDVITDMVAINSEIEKCLLEIQLTASFNHEAMRYTLNILRGTLINHMNQSVANDDFENAESCRKLLKDIDHMISTGTVCSE